MSGPSQRAGSERPWRARAPAKINLTLAVSRPARPDGYHELRGVFACLTLADEVTVSLRGDASPDDGDSLRVRPRSVGVGAPDDLAIRALAALRTLAEGPLPPLAVTIRKRIPVAAGLAGGSSDAAAALRLGCAAWGLDVSPDELAAVALGLGSDVPFFLSPSPVALVGGRGERIEPLPANGIAGTGVLLVVAEGKASTAAVFAAHDAEPAEPAAPPAEPPAWAARDRLVRLIGSGATPTRLVDIAPELRAGNDLYPAASRITPGLAALRQRVEAILGRPALLSGAGPTVFVLYASLGEADAALRLLRGRLAAGGAPGSPRLIATEIAGTAEGGR